MALLVGAIVLLLGNYLLIEFFVKNARQLALESARKTADLASRMVYIGERNVWEERNNWAKSQQPRMNKPDRAGPELLDMLRQQALKAGVQMESPTIDKPDYRTFCTAAQVNFEAKGKWEAMCGFLREMQSPERFIVFEAAQLQLDPSDKTQLRGVFKVAKWYAPK
jgi:hypothetical protein